ncbi:hypothetical protein B0F90DRAFT_1723111 [Multifurca ochricompacta]|uniref:Uncharacterized protein n=1 Tax=Multifurca ochricompacta TaxID=376703 RepID=A0AAD4M340_9AGAM|nr:hypothetical protein B0F90DRAFT_1723111 [Multifurca ochricompacta]
MIDEMRKGDDLTHQQTSSLSQSSRPPPPPSLPPPPPYSNEQSTTHYVVATVPFEPRESAGVRFIKAFFVAILVWVIAGIFVSSVVELSTLPRSARWNIMKDNITIPAIDDGHIDNCAPWTGISDRIHPPLPQFSSGAWSSAKFNLPADVGVYFVAHGVLASGDLYVRESYEAKDISVKVFMRHRGAEVLSRATICQLSRDDGQIGIGIFTPRSWYSRWLTLRRNDVHFVVVVELPSSRSAVRYMPSFHANLPMFSFALDDLSNLRFGDVILKSTNSPIRVQGMIANTMEVHSMNGGIRGALNVTDHLTLMTTNSPISVKIGAENRRPDKSTEMLIKTSNGLIEANISLTSSTSLGAGGTFGVHTYTTNGPIKIVYNDSPVDSLLNFDAQSTNSPVHTVLHRAYEGTFAIQTTNADAVLSNLRNVEDPSGHQRRRRLSSHYVSRHIVNGDVKWEPSSDNGQCGSVNIATTNDLINLTI